MRTREQKREVYRRWCKKNADILRAKKRAYADTRKAQRKIANRKWQGLPVPTRPEPIHCECCGKPPQKKGICLDHCHTSGEFRGWLCTNCNVAIGLLGDCLKGLELAAQYLKRFEHSFD